jgi:hypothetical protein
LLSFFKSFGVFFMWIIYIEQFIIVIIIKEQLHMKVCNFNLTKCYLSKRILLNS